MANEFSRQESVSDYEVYQGREGSQLNFAEEAAKITTGVNAIATAREGKKAKIQADTDDVIAQLEKADSFQNQTLGQTVLLAAKGLKETLLMQSQLMKKGKIKGFKNEGKKNCVQLKKKEHGEENGKKERKKEQKREIGVLGTEV